MKMIDDKRIVAALSAELEVEKLTPEEHSVWSEKFAEAMDQPSPEEEAFFENRRKFGLGVGLDDDGAIVRQNGPVFIDFEASSLNAASWPIEVGLAWLDGRRVVVESKLIRPRPEWPEDDWNLESQEVHGIPRADLDNAESADEVSAWLLQAVGDSQLVSDAPEFDQHWLDRLLGKSGPEIADFDQMLFAAFSDDGCVAPGRLNKAYKNMMQRRVVHRAGDDAAHLCYAWRAGVGK